MARTNEQVWAGKWKGRKEPVNAFAKTLVRRSGSGNNRKLLDVGCGNGMDSLFFARQGFRVTALDFSPSGIEELRRAIRTFETANIEAELHDISKKFSYPDGSFDVIYAHLSLHYFEDALTRKIFCEMKRLLKAKGTFFVKCKSVDDCLYGEGEKVGPDMYRSGHTRHFFRFEYLRSMLDGFMLKDIRKTSSSYHGKKSAFVQAVAVK